MNQYSLSAYLGFSIVFAAMIGLVRFGKVLPAYRPFYIYTWINFCNQLLSFILIEIYKDNSVNGNLYVLAEAFLFLWLFWRWGLFRNKPWLIKVILSLLIITWIFDNLIWHRITTVNSLFRVTYSFTLAFLAINQINRIIGEERGNLLRNAQFLICVILIPYYTYKAIIEVFYLIQLQASHSFYNNLFVIFIFVNLFANLIYAIAALWIPTRQKFTMRY